MHDRAKCSFDLMHGCVCHYIKKSLLTKKTAIFIRISGKFTLFFIRNWSIRNRLSGNFGAKKLSPTLVLGSKIHKKLFKK